LRAKGYEVPLPIEVEVQTLLAELKVEALTPVQRLEPGDQLVNSLRVRVAQGDQPVVHAPVVLAGDGREIRLTTSDDGVAPFDPEGSASWPEGNRVFQAHLTHPAIARAASRFSTPEPASFVISVRPLNDTEAAAHNRAALGRMASSIVAAVGSSGRAAELQRIAVLRAAESNESTELGEALGRALESALGATSAFEMASRLDAEGFVSASSTRGDGTAEIDGVLVSRASVAGQKTHLSARLVDVDTTALVAATDETLRFTSAWQAARARGVFGRSGVEITASFLYQDRSTRSRSLDDGMTLYAGNRYQIFFQPQQTAHVYVYQMDGRGTVYPFFPNPDFSPLQNPVPAGQAVALPSAEWSFELDDSVGTEELVVLASCIPLREVEGVFGTLLAGQKVAAEANREPGSERRALTVGTKRKTLDLAREILSNPTLGTVKRVKFVHK
jgi:hypothetical protein